MTDDVSQGTQFTSLEDLEKFICEKHGITPIAFKSPRRGGELVDARKEFSKMARAMRPQPSYPTIGRYLNRDHTSIMYLVKKQ